MREARRRAIAPMRNDHACRDVRGVDLASRGMACIARAAAGVWMFGCATTTGWGAPAVPVIDGWKGMAERLRGWCGVFERTYHAMPTRGEVNEQTVQSQRWLIEYEFGESRTRVVIDRRRADGSAGRRSEYVVGVEGGWVEHRGSENDGEIHRRMIGAGETVDGLMRSEFDLMVAMIDVRSAWTLTQDPRPVWEIMSAPGTTMGFTRGDGVGGDGSGGMVVIDLAYDPVGRAAVQNPARREARVEADGSSGWRIVRSRTAWSDIDCRTEVGYEPGVSHPFPARVESVTVTPGAEVQTRFRLLRAFECVAPASLPDEAGEGVIPGWVAWGGGLCAAFGTLLVVRAVSRRGQSA